MKRVLRRCMKEVLLLAVLLPACAGAASGQTHLESREGDATRGPVRSVRVERANYVEAGGGWVEGPRRLVSLKVYSHGGRQSETTSYKEDGTVESVRVYAYHEDGRLAEEAHYDGAGSLLLSRRYGRDDGEVLTFGPDGLLRERDTAVWDEARTKVVGRRVYDSGGALLREDMNTRDGHTSAWSTYDGAGRLSKKTVHRLGRAGGHRSEAHAYKDDGTAVLLYSWTGDSGAGGAAGGPVGPLAERREYDARGNLSKQIHYRRNRETGEDEPRLVTYHEVSYF